MATRNERIFTCGWCMLLHKMKQSTNSMAIVFTTSLEFSFGIYITVMRKGFYSVFYSVTMWSFSFSLNWIGRVDKPVREMQQFLRVSFFFSDSL